MEVIMGMKVGYARVSTVGQKLNVQMEHLADGDRIFREKAKARGVVFGARPKLTSQEIVELLKNYETPGSSKLDIAEHYGISTSSVYRL
jgi:DNA invertase Pin-like site-specific DNA recombinase